MLAPVYVPYTGGGGIQIWVSIDLASDQVSAWGLDSSLGILNSFRVLDGVSGLYSSMQENFFDELVLGFKNARSLSGTHREIVISQDLCAANERKLAEMGPK